MNNLLKKIALLYLIVLLTTIPGNTLYMAAPILPVTQEVEEAPQAEADTNEVPASQTITYTPPEMGLPDIKSIDPKTITLPSIQMQASVVKVGKLANGQMGVPENIETVGWYKPGPRPGSNGNAVLAGHVDGANRPGAFFHLKKMKKGDLVHVEGMNGEKLTFKVKEIASYYPDQAPIEKIFGYSPERNLNLITCTGSFNHEEGGYEERLVVYTELVGE
ncbi:MULTISPECIES: class F sortase [Mesobacillus]|uniref:Class F sortase n=1 Tax=Mesobacillus selenatarsenatis TaxID=388741 RepID=A0A846TLI2_9BACI|nr:MULTISPECIES: class F sortase [Mesobacillus]NKE07639.1 class F sortase [Mesobacillus selenatarsenatis]